MTTTITDRLAIGLARAAIRDWRAEVERCLNRLGSLLFRDVSTGKAARRLARDVAAAVRPVALGVVSLEVRKRGTLQFWVVPNIWRTDQGDYLQIDMQSVAIKLEGLDPLNDRVMLLVHSHALARLFLRLQSADRADVQEEIGSTVLIGAALAEACGRLGLQQVIFPTRSGVFRCDLVRIDEGMPVVAAKTWIADKAASPRDMAVSDSISHTLAEWAATIRPVETLQLLLMSVQLPEDLVEGLCAALAPHGWLKEAYVERADPLSELWAAARGQAN